MLTSKACLMTMLFSKVLFAKMTEPGTADILSLNSITFEKMKTSETVVFILDSNYGNIKILPIFVFSYTL